MMNNLISFSSDLMKNILLGGESLLQFLHILDIHKNYYVFQAFITAVFWKIKIAT